MASSHGFSEVNDRDPIVSDHDSINDRESQPPVREVESKPLPLGPVETRAEKQRDVMPEPVRSQPMVRDI